MRTGVLGGTFDPPHAGHLRMARLAQAQLGLDRVLFVPCHAQPLKDTLPWASSFHRAAMVALALASKPGWLLETAELERGGISYTVETLEALAAAGRRDRLVLIMGSDSLLTFPYWRRQADILALAGLAVVPRGGPLDLPQGVDSRRVHLLQARPLRVSSTLIRERLKRSESVIGLVPRAVAAYIERQGLYGLARQKTARRND